MKPTLPNRTGRHTQADVVQTPKHIAQIAFDHFQPSGFLLDPARGQGAFYDLMTGQKDWCEIEEGRDFFDWKEEVDWIITNSPYSIYDKFLEHCFKVAKNVVLLVPIAKAFKSMKIERMVDQYGGLREIYLIGGGGKCGFSFGFPTGYLHYEMGYKGKITRTIH